MEDTLVPLDHPCLEGHFPENPIVPGTIILEKVVKALIAKWPGCKAREISRAKFLSPLRPGETFSLRIIRNSEDVRFECNRNDRLIASGHLTVTDNG